MKKDYSAPEMEIVVLNDEDIVTASGPQSVTTTFYDPWSETQHES